MNDVVLNHHLELAIGIFCLCCGAVAAYGLWVALGPRDKKARSPEG